MHMFVNLITASRIIGLVPFLVLFFAGQYAAAFVIFVALALTDCADGWLARRYGCVTEWGKFFVPFADKVFLLTVLFLLLPAVFFSEFIVLMLIEFALLWTSLLAYIFPAYIGKALGANQFGKNKAFGEVVCAVAVFYGLIMRQPLYWEAAILLLWAIILLAALSLIGHWWPYFSLARETAPCVSKT